MGGYGSGRPSHKKKAEECRSLDVNRMHQEGCLNAGWSGNWIWSRDGKEVARIGFRAETARIVLNYRISQYGGDWEQVTQSVPLDHTSCNYGGQRPYFLCPGVVNGRQCNRRAVKLFSGGKYFLCRHCYKLAYTSQSESRYDRMLRRANKLRRALGGEAGMVNRIAPKPKGMSHRMYQRKREEIEWFEGQADRIFIAKFKRFLSKEEQELYFDDPWF